MFRRMRRFKQELGAEEAEAILSRNNLGVLGVNGDGGYPYTVPVNYAYEGGRIYFHGANAGHKFDAMARDGRVCFTVIDKDDIDSERLTTLFRSVIVFGRVRIIDEPAELRERVRAFGLRFNPDAAKVDAEIEREMPTLRMFELTPEHVTGKEAIELVRER